MGRDFPGAATVIGIVAHLVNTAVQYILELPGMWVSLRWSPFYTFLLAVVTHSIMTGYLLIRYRIRA